MRFTHFFLAFVCRLLDRFEDGMKFSVEFTISDLTLRLQHRAAELAVEKKLQKVLFPPRAFPSQQTELPRLRLEILVQLWPKVLRHVEKNVLYVHCVYLFV